MCEAKTKAFKKLCSILKILKGFSADLEIPNRTSEKTRLCLAGVNGDEVTPVPIPNTEVKLISVENTWLETAWEDRAMPAQKWLLSVILTGAFLRIEMLLACFRNS